MNEANLRISVRKNVRIEQPDRSPFLMEIMEHHHSVNTCFGRPLRHGPGLDPCASAQQRGAPHGAAVRRQRDGVAAPREVPQRRVRPQVIQGHGRARGPAQLRPRHAHGLRAPAPRAFSSATACCPGAASVLAHTCVLLALLKATRRPGERSGS